MQSRTFENDLTVSAVGLGCMDSAMLTVHRQRKRKRSV